MREANETMKTEVGAEAEAQIGHVKTKTMAPNKAASDHAAATAETPNATVKAEKKTEIKALDRLMSKATVNPMPLPATPRKELAAVNPDARTDAETTENAMTKNRATKASPAAGPKASAG